MSSHGRRQFLKRIGGAATIGTLAGCTGDGGGDGNGGTTTTGGGMASVTIIQPEGTVFYPFFEGALAEGIFEDEGVDLTVEYRPFPAQVQSITSGEVNTAQVSALPYLSNVLKGEDLVTFGFDGNLQSVNALYVLADSDYHSLQDLQGQRIGVWSFGSSTVQAFEAIMAARTGLELREDFETTTAAPPALVGLLQDGEVDGVIDISGLTIAMESQPDTFRNIAQLNAMWLEETGFTLPLTGWFSYADWYESNTETAAGLIAGSRRAAAHWQENTVSLLEEFGEPAGIDNQAKIDVVERWANQGQVFLAEQSSEYVDATWEFVSLMNEHGFIESVPDQSEVLRNPMN